MSGSLGRGRVIGGNVITSQDNVVAKNVLVSVELQVVVPLSVCAWHWFICHGRDDLAAGSFSSDRRSEVGGFLDFSLRGIQLTSNSSGWESLSVSVSKEVGRILFDLFEVKSTGRSSVGSGSIICEHTCHKGLLLTSLGSSHLGAHCVCGNELWVGESDPRWSSSTSLSFVDVCGSDGWRHVVSRHTDCGNVPTDDVLVRIDLECILTECSRLSSYGFVAIVNDGRVDGSSVKGRSKVLGLVDPIDPRVGSSLKRGGKSLSGQSQGDDWCC